MSQNDPNQIPPDADLGWVLREIDLLKTALNKPPDPWYHNGPLLVSIAAFAFSLITGLVSAYRAHRQEINDARAELRSLIAQISSLPTQVAETRAKYGQTDAGLAIASSLRNQSEVLSQQTVVVAQRIRKELSAAECIAVAGAIVQEEPALAEQILKLGVDHEANIDEYLAVRRQLGMIEIMLGHSHEGDTWFGDAMGSFHTSKYVNEPFDPTFKSWSNGYTEIRWADAYFAARKCSQASIHLAGALNIMKTLNQPSAESLEPYYKDESRKLSYCRPG